MQSRRSRLAERKAMSDSQVEFICATVMVVSMLMFFGFAEWCSTRKDRE